MANISSIVNVLSVFNSTSIDSTGAATNYTTGVTAVLSTAGSSGVGLQSTTYGGYPFASAAWDMAGFEGALVIANITSWTTGPAGSNATLQIYGNAGGPTTALSTTFTILRDAYAYGMSSTPFALWVDVNKPKTRYLQAQVQVPSSSQVATTVNVIRYGAKIEPTVTGSTVLGAPGGAAAAFGAVSGFYTSIGAGT